MGEKFFKPSEELQQSMKILAEELSKTVAVQDIISPLVKNFAISFNAEQVMAPLIQAFNMSSVAQNSALAISDAWKQTFNTNEIMSPLFEAFNQSMVVQDSLTPVIRAFNESVRTQDVMSSLLKAFSESMKTNNIMSPLMVDINNTASWIAKFNSNLKFGGFDVSEDGLVIVDNQSISVSDIQEVAEQCIEAVGNQASFEAKINCYMETAGRQHPVVAKILIYILIPIIINVVTSSYFTTSNSTWSQHNKVVTRQIKKKVQSVRPAPEFYSQYRFIAVNILNVRASNRIDGPLIGKLYLGQVVRVICKDRNWIKVEYTNEEMDTQIRGWVLTRYTSKFK